MNLFGRATKPSFDQYADLLERLESERRRSAKLIEALGEIADSPWLLKRVDLDHIKQIARQAACEYLEETSCG